MIDKCFVYPTDTVWGIGGSIESEASATTIQKVKGTSGHKPVSVMFKNIGQMREYLDFPSFVHDSWLTPFFSLETTLAVSKSLLKKDVGQWVVADSDLIAVRCLPYPGIEKIIDAVGAPITTTSFNLTGTPPLTELKDVKLLLDSLDYNLELVADNSAFLSGNSSSILVLEKVGTFKFLREGRLVDEVKRHCSLLTT